MDAIRATTILPAMALVLASACATQNPMQMPPGAVRCTEPRPQICTMDYNPVCATLDDAERCLSPPCPSRKVATYANGCGACADARVLYYQPGACDE